MLAAASGFCVSVSDLVRRACGWWAVGAAVATSAVFVAVALRLDPPAFAVASLCVLILAVSLGIRLITWVAASGATFGREERLISFVALLAIGLGWLGAREWIAERDFDYRAAQQKADLILVLRDLSSRIDGFAASRNRVAPPHPRPATWQHDEDTFERFEEETVVEYERSFGAEVRMARNPPANRGVEDRDFHSFSPPPGHEFPIRVIGKKPGQVAARARRRWPGLVPRGGSFPIPRKSRMGARGTPLRWLPLRPRSAA